MKTTITEEMTMDQKLELELDLEGNMEQENTETPLEELLDDVEDFGTVDEAFQQYLKQIGKVPLLSAEEEQELGRMIQAGGSEAMDARNRLVEANLRLVVHYAKQCVGRGVDIEDLNLMGCEGLIRAAEKFDYTLGYRFSTYASCWIKQAISRGMAEEGDTIRIPIHMNEIRNKVRKAQKELYQCNMVEPTPEELAAFLDIPEHKVKEAMDYMQKVVSFDVKVGEDGDSTLEDLLSDDSAVNPCENAIAVCREAAVSKALQHLDEREAKVLRLRYGIGYDAPFTLDQVASLPEFNCTRERIRQIENKAILKIRRSPSLRRELLDFAS